MVEKTKMAHLQTALYGKISWSTMLVQTKEFYQVHMSPNPWNSLQILMVQRVNPNDFAYLLTFPLAPSSGGNFNMSNNILTNIRWIFIKVGEHSRPPQEELWITWWSQFSDWTPQLVRLWSRHIKCQFHDLCGHFPGETECFRIASEIHWSPLNTQLLHHGRLLPGCWSAVNSLTDKFPKDSSLVKCRKWLIERGDWCRGGGRGLF